jgi:transcriptional regulator with PAS, ATPase and Fis domain
MPAAPSEPSMDLFLLPSFDEEEDDDKPRTQSIVPLFRSPQAITALRSSAGVVYPLPRTGSRWMVGTHPTCELILEDRCVSSIHCAIERAPHGELVVRDRGSRNGTFLDGHAIEGALLSVGSRLLLGKTTLVALGEERGAAKSAWESLRGAHPMFQRALACADKAAASECSVLVVGETGTGKDLVARAIHERSRRSAGPFVAVNCGAIPRELAASELFGHERGAFTGAAVERDGYFAQADGGTLFLDELGELPIELQPHLLRALEARKIRRVGGELERAVDVRVIAATHRVDGLGTDASRLRPDLFHRIAAVVIAMPSLRDRAGDVKLLVSHFLDEMGDGLRRVVSDDAWDLLLSYQWPGNARELRQAVARAIALGDQVLEPKDFFPDMGVGGSSVRALRITAKGEPLAAYEVALHDEMVRSLTMHRSVRAAAAALGMPKSTFADRARQWGLVLPRAKQGA